MSEAERFVHFGSSRSFLTQPADLLYGGLYGEGAGAWHEAFLHAMTLLESNAVDATRQAQAALTLTLTLTPTLTRTLTRTSNPNPNPNPKPKPKPKPKPNPNPKPTPYR